MTERQLALKWLIKCAEHQITCNDETCELWWAFAHFLKKNATPEQIARLEQRAVARGAAFVPAHDKR